VAQADLKRDKLLREHFGRVDVVLTRSVPAQAPVAVRSGNSSGPLRTFAEWIAAIGTQDACAAQMRCDCERIADKSRRGISGSFCFWEGRGLRAR
jgi:hypothetical protein